MTEFPQEQIRMNAEAYRDLPESPFKTELINGELIVYKGSDGMSPAAKDIHEETVMLIIAFLLTIIPPNELRASKTDVYLDEKNVVQPDIFWASSETKQCVRAEDGYLHGAPDLIIEVLSPSTAELDKTTKFALYEKFGVREYWLVDIDAETIEVYALRTGKFTLMDVYQTQDQFQSPVLKHTVPVAKLLP